MTAGDGDNVYSVTKSVVSALVGIALGEGKLKGLDQTVDELPRVQFADGRYHQPGPPSLHLRGPTASPPGAAQVVGVDQLELTEEFAFRDGELLVGEEPLGAKLAELLQPIDWVSRLSG